MGLRSWRMLNAPAAEVIYIYISFFLIPVQGQLPCFSSVRVERVFGLARTALFIGEGGDGREGVRIV